MIKAYPIPFNGPLVRAILDGRKTQTRRVIEPQPTSGDVECINWPAPKINLGTYTTIPKCKYGQPGDRLWVRESWRVCRQLTGDRFWIQYKDGKHNGVPSIAQDALFGIALKHGDNWRPPMFMFRWASRLTLLVNQVRRERLHAMSRGHVIREGASNSVDDPLWFVDLWNSLHKKPGTTWGDNPEVVVIGFRPVLANIDSLEAAA